MAVANKPKPKKVIDPNACRFLIQPLDATAVVQIGGTIYMVKNGVGPRGERYWQFHKETGECWTVSIRGGEWITCTCPDRMYRRRECKHSRTVRVLYLSRERSPS